MSKREKNKFPKFMPIVLTEKTKRLLIKRIGQIIEMYKDIGKGYLVLDWVCLCKGLDCTGCPVLEVPACTGPGGDWAPIKTLVDLYSKIAEPMDLDEIELGPGFRYKLKHFLETECDWDSGKKTLSETQLKSKARYWTVERIQAFAEKKARAWDKWLKEFKKVNSAEYRASKSEK